MNMKPKFEVGQTVHFLDGTYEKGEIIGVKETLNTYDGMKFRYWVEMQNDIKALMEYQLFATKKELLESLWL